MRGILSAVTVASGMLLALSTVTPALPANAAPGDPTDGFEYVSLGDSYSAGYGLAPFSHSSPFPGAPNGCFQAEANYPHLIAADLGLQLADQTCTGAITANIGYPDGFSIPSPPAGTPLTGLPTGSMPQTTGAGVTAPGVQSATLSASTDVVTVGIGGNDLGFTSIALGCVRQSIGEGTFPAYLSIIAEVHVPNCRDYFDDSATYPDSYLKDRLANNVVPRVAATLERVSEAAPNAQVFLVGYPRIAPDTATDSCFSTMGTPNDVPFSGADLNFMHEIEQLLDGALAATAAAQGVHYISNWDATAGHTLCSGEPKITGLSWYPNLGQPSCDTGYVPGDPSGQVCVNFGAMHPNAAGVESMRQVVATQVSSAFFTRIVDGDLKPGGSLTAEGGGFYPGESVELVLNSTPVTIGTATANADGGFSATADIPADVPAGAHTLVATGATSGHSFSAAVELAAIPGGDPGTGGPSELAETGAGVTGLVIAGGALVILGVGILLLRRRRARAAGLS